jgi:hypothetical protein
MQPPHTLALRFQQLVGARDGLLARRVVACRIPRLFQRD